MESLLPPNSSALERGIEAAMARLDSHPLRTLYNPDTCPAHLLHELAWAWSVDHWDDSWSEPVKRSVIRSAFYVHAHKGTLGALRRAVAPLGIPLSVREWWQSVPEGPPGTFSLEIGVPPGGIDEGLYQKALALIDDAKPVSRHMTGLAVGLECFGTLGFALCVDEGECIDVYPPVFRGIQVSGELGLTPCLLESEFIDVYPPVFRGIQATGALRLCPFSEQGEFIDVYPPIYRDIDVTGALRLVMCIDEFETVETYQ